MWEFKLDNIIVDEPIGWDGITFNLKRDKGGVLFEYSDNLTFDGVGYEILKNKYENFGVDAKCLFTVYYCGNKEYEYVVNFTNYSIFENNVTVNIEQTDFMQKFKNRMGLNVELEKDTSIDGVSIHGDTSRTVWLHSKVMQKLNRWEYSKDFEDYETASTWSNQGHEIRYELNIPVVNTKSELSSVYDIQNYFGITTNGINDSTNSPIMITYEKGLGDVVRVKGRLKLKVQEEILDYTGPTLDRQVSIRVFCYSSPLPPTIFFNGGNACPVAGSYDCKNIFSDFRNLNDNALFDFDIDETFDFNLSIKQEFKIYFSVIVIDVPINFSGTDVKNTLARIKTFDDTYIDITQDTFESPTQAKVFLIHEAFDKLIQIYTNEVGRFYSEAMGRTDLGYSQDGCMAYISITNGLNIRQAKQGDTLFNIATSFNELFASISALYNLGWGIENENTLRIEPIEFFYNKNSLIKLENVSGIKRMPAIDKLFNEVTFGYKTWNLNNSIQNGLDEFNSTRIYHVPIENTNRKVANISNYIASGYVIETTRRKQFEIQDNSTFETDNEMFFISLNISSITTDEFEGSMITYGKGTVSERDENFSGLTNVLFPESLYNIRLSPLRAASRFFKDIAGVLYRVNPICIYLSGEGNVIMRSRDINSCIDITTQTQENAPLQDFFCGNPDRYFESEYIEFEYPISKKEFDLIRNNVNFAIEFTCDGINTQKGFVESVSYKPTAEGGAIASFKLLQAPII